MGLLRYMENLVGKFDGQVNDPADYSVVLHSLHPYNKVAGKMSISFVGELVWMQSSEVENSEELSPDSAFQ